MNPEIVSHVVVDLVIFRNVKVDRNRTPLQVVEATGYTGKGIHFIADCSSMLRGEKEEVDVYFFPLRKYTGIDEIEKEYALRGLTPDPYAQCAIIEANPNFVDEHPNFSQWDVYEYDQTNYAGKKVGKSLGCSAIQFRLSCDCREVWVVGAHRGWNEGLWVCGVRNSDSSNPQT